ncbi:MAG: DUF2127 domain-containing protein [Rhodanobacteraceae bacterium]
MSEVERGPRALALIAVFKFLKSALLVVVAFALFHLRDPEVSQHWALWLHSLPIATGHRQISELIGLMLDTKASTIDVFTGIALGYSTLFAIEGFGLWRNAHWAEYLTVVTTSLLVPVEIWEIFHHPTPMKVLALLINLAIVAYLVRLLRNERRAGGHAKRLAESAADS